MRARREKFLLRLNLAERRTFSETNPRYAVAGQMLDGNKTQDEYIEGYNRNDNLKELGIRSNKVDLQTSICKR